MSRTSSAVKALEVRDGALRAIERALDSPADNPNDEHAVVTAEPNSDSPKRSEAPRPDPLRHGCRRSTWTLNPQILISFGGMEEASATEEFRTLRSRLYSVRKERSLKSILIASALPKEGRSFVAVNLAQALSLQEQCRVLLIDADLRNPRLHSVFGTSATPGFSDYSLQEMKEFEVMQAGCIENLFLIPAGRSVAGPTELVANGRLKSLIDRVESFFDWIIIDSSAALPVCDAGLLANCCDGVLLVVRSKSTPFDIVRKAQRRFREESMVGVVLNHIEERLSAAPSPDKAPAHKSAPARELLAEE